MKRQTHMEERQLYENRGRKQSDEAISQGVQGLLTDTKIGWGEELFSFRVFKKSLALPIP